MSQSSTYDTIIFDLDGTLLNTIDDLADSLNFLLEKHQYPTYSVEQVKGFVGNGIRKLIERSLPKDASEAEITSFFEEYSLYYKEHCQVKTQAYPGIYDLLNILKEKGIRTAIVTNKNDDAANALKDQFFPTLVTLCIGVSEKNRKKPAPDTVFTAMKKLNSTPSKTLYVGDSEVDYQTAQNASLDCCLVSWGFREKSQLKNLSPTFLIDTPQDILSFL